MHPLTHLHDCAVDDDEVLWRGLDGAALPRVARVEEQRGPLQAHPVALPTALPGQLNLQGNRIGSSGSQTNQARDTCLHGDSGEMAIELS